MADEAPSGETHPDDLATGSRPASGEPWWSPAVRVLRWFLGASTLVGGLTWILLNLSGPKALLEATVGGVLAAGGLVLLMPHRIRLPRLATTVATATAAFAGTAAGLVAESAHVCCMFAYVANRGWPFPWVQRGAAADDAAAAYRLAQSADWHVDLVSLAASLLTWAYVGLLGVAAAVLARRARHAT